jgi:CheY-like chemotaxis protein
MSTNPGSLAGGSFEAAAQFNMILATRRQMQALEDPGSGSVPEVESGARESSGPAIHLPVVLLVEDDPADARLIMRAIERVKIPARVVHVKNGDDAVSYLAGTEQYGDRKKYPLPCLVLMDVKLPRRWGLEVLQWMRSQKSGVERVPVVMLTSSQEAVDIRQAYDFGVNSYLVKPENTDQLLRMVSVLKDYWFSLNQAPPEQRD